VAATPRTVPAAPRSLVATAGDGSATLSWEPPVSDGGAPVERYVVTVTPSDGVPRTLESVSTTLEVAGLVNRLAYVFSVAAVNAAGAGPAIETGPVVPRAPASAVLSSVFVDPAGPVTADGVSAALVTVVVRDAEGFALAGQAVSVMASGTGNSLVQLSATTDADGIVTATLASTVAQEKALTVTVNGSLDLIGVPTVTFVPGPAARLRVLRAAPASAIAGVTFAPAIRVAVEDARGNAVAGGPVVTLSRSSGPVGGALLGTLSVAAAAGVATLDAVWTEIAGTYSLQAAMDGLVPVNCGAVLVRAAPPTHLTFDVQPGPFRARELAPTLKVGFRDDFDNLSSPGKIMVTAGLAPTSDFGVLMGLTLAPQSNGVASFQYLSVDEPGTYAIVASAPGFAPVTSARFAVTEAWELVSPEGGDVTSVAVATDGSVVYALTSTNPTAGRVWRSLDGGVTWERASAGLVATVVHVATDPTSPMRAYAAALSAGLYVTENGGLRWRRLAAFRSDRVGVGPDGTLLVKDGATIRRSTDRGVTWGADVTLPSYVSCFAFDPSDAATAYAGTWKSGVLRSSDGGASWSLAGDLASAGYVHRITIDPGSLGTVWAAMDKGLYQSFDAGSSWTLSGGMHLQWTDVVPDPSVPGRLYGARSGSLVRSDDGGGTWSEAGLSFVASLFPVPGAGGRPSAILADGIYDGHALYRLAEGGIWERSSAGLRGALPLIAVHPADPSIVLAANQGVQRTADGGETWGPSTGQSFGSMAFDPFEPSRVLGVTPQSALFRSSDGGVTWDNPVTISGPLLFDRASRGTVFATYSNTVYRSVDGGASWSPSNAGWPAASGPIRFFVQDPVDPRVLIASTSSAGLWRSVDGGATWAAMNGPSTSVSALSIDPRDDRVLVALDSSGVSLTSDGGATWQPVTTLAPLADGVLARDPWSPDVLLAGRTERLHRSDDGGKTWKSASSGYLGGGMVFQIHFAAPGLAYVSSSTGVYRTRTGGR